MIIMVKNPRVRKIIGPVISLSIGLRKKLTNVNKNETQTSVGRMSVGATAKLKPGIKRAAAMIAIAFANI